MANKQWVAGNKVKLISGGPEMAVVEQGLFGYSAKETVRCQWFDKSGKLQEGEFDPDTLESA